MKPGEARRYIEKNCVFSVMPAKCFVCGPREEKARDCRAYSDRFEFSGVKTGKRYVIAYKALKLEWDASVFLILDAQWQLSEPIGFERIPEFRFRMADALAALRLAYQKAGDVAAFENEARAYREMAVKPQLGEDVRRLKVQAEAAIREKSFHDAADLYEEALALAPWWPEGRFNRALVLAEIQDFSGAIGEMRRYLMLVPDAPDARAVQDRMYEWERKASR